MTLDRRRFLLSSALAAAATALPPAIARALEIPASSKTGTIRDVEHVVILTQENRSFDHYFGTMRGVRGFGDRFAIPSSSTQNSTVFVQPDEHDSKKSIAPFRLDTTKSFNQMRVSGTPHTFPDAQKAWDNGRMSHWPDAKHNRAMGYFTREDIPFQFALAEAFTICDAYHCALHAGTNPNRVYLWTGTNDAAGAHHGPVTDNGYDHLSADPKGHGGYEWVTYPERLTAAGVSWQIYQDMDDNFTDNPLAGFRLYRLADKAKDGPLAELAKRSIRTRDIDRLKADALADKMPQVSWIIATAAGSEHPTPSSPAQGADYTARVLDALTANPEVWARTVLLINFDENDGFFDHVPPPAPPAQHNGQPLGESQVDTTGEYHLEKDEFEGRPYGLGPRVPMYVVSPWSKGGFVNSQVFDHTSVIRFLETRFGVHEPNITAWRRAVCGDLTTCFDFASPQVGFPALPDVSAAAKKARGLLLTTDPDAPKTLAAPTQETGVRPARLLPYALSADGRYKDGGFNIDIVNSSQDIATVLHLYNHKNLSFDPDRVTIPAGRTYVMAGVAADVSLYGPNGFYRRFFSTAPFAANIALAGATLTLLSPASVTLTWRDEAYGQGERHFDLKPDAAQTIALDFSQSHGWYDFTVSGDSFWQRFAGHIEDGKPSISDPALGGPAPLEMWAPKV